MMFQRQLRHESGNALRTWTNAVGVRLVQQMPRRENAEAQTLLCKDPLDRLEKDIEVDWFAALIRKSTTAKSLGSVYNRIAREGYGGSVYLSNLVVQMYGRCGNIREARAVFDKIRSRNLFSWNIMISAYAQRGYPLEAIQLYERMDVPANGMTFTSVLSACAALGNLKLGQEVHASILSSGVQSSVILDTALVNMYAKCGCLDVAREVFDRIPRKTVVSWNSLIAAYAQTGHPSEALELYERMLSQGVQPDRVTFVSVLTACNELPALVRVNEKIEELGAQSDVVVSTSLVNMYAKCGRLETAKRVFDGIENKNVISWNSMLTAYAAQGESNKEVGELYRFMDLEGVPPDSITFATVLGACVDLEEGRRIHAEAQPVGKRFTSTHERVMVETALVRMYARLGRIDEASRIFEEMQHKDLVAWNATIAASVQAGEWKLAIEFFNRMVLENSVKGDKTTFTSILSACSSLGALQVGEGIHDKFIRQTELETDLGVQNGLLNLYAKCGHMKHAREVLEKMKEKDEVSMNVMIAAYAQQGYSGEAIQLFREMDLEGIAADSTTFTSVVTACSASGAIGFGKRIHERVLTFEKKKLLPNVVLETALLSMYGKCGTLQQAKEVFQAMQEKNLITWNAVLGACAHQGDADEAIETLRAAALNGVQLDSTSFISALIACSHAGKLEIAYDCFMLMVTEHDLDPVAENYRCMVDLLARSGKLAEAEELMRMMPFEPDAIAWRTFLAACKLHGSWDDRVAAVAEEAFKLDPCNTAPYILLSSIYSAAGKQDEFTQLRSSMKEKVIKKLVPGKSAIEILGRVHEFVAGDTSHPQSEAILAELELLSIEMRRLGFVPSVDVVVHDVREEEKEGLLGLHSEKLAVALGLISTKAGAPLLVLKNLRICSDCHAAMKLISKVRDREITVRDANRFHRFHKGLCTCGDYW